MFIKTYLRQKLVAKREFNNTMDKQAVKVVKDDELVGHLPRKLSWIVLYFLARSGDCTVERNQWSVAGDVEEWRFHGSWI